MKTLQTILILTIIVFSAEAHTVENNIEIVSLEKVPIIEVHLNGKTAYFVLDSGSDVSLLHLGEVENYQFYRQKRASKSIVGASGGKQPLFEASQIELQIGHQPLKTMYYTTDLSSIVESLSNSTGFTISGIIGMDLMRKYGFEIDYGNQELSLNF
jgi:hypothetical protein